MKKIISLMAVGVMFFTHSNAQQVMSPPLDTNSGTTIRNITTPKLVSLNTGDMALQYVGTKISGTISGKVYLQGAVDAVNYVTVDSLTLADQAVNTKIFDVTDKRRLAWRFNVSTSGTQVLTNKGYYLERK